MDSLSPRTSSHPTAGGLALAVSHWRGRADLPELLFAHGFGQTRGAWRGAAQALAAEGYACTTFDARGHGESAREQGGGYEMQSFVDDLLELAGNRQPVLIGASMGGLLGLVAAGEYRPAPFSALVLVDITPRWETRGVERILAFMQAHPDGFADYAEAAEQIAQYLPQRRERKRADQLRPLLREGDDGRLRWHWDPALLSGDLVTQSERYQPRLLSAAAKVEVPVLLISGARSDVVSRATVDEFLALVPHAQHVEVPDASHMLAGDANDAFTAAVAGFVRGLQHENARKGGIEQPAMRC